MPTTRAISCPPVFPVRFPYPVTSNRESGFGRYDVLLEPCGKKDASAVNGDEKDAIILEFKVHDPEDGCRCRKS